MHTYSTPMMRYTASLVRLRFFLQLLGAHSLGVAALTPAAALFFMYMNIHIGIAHTGYASAALAGICIAMALINAEAFWKDLQRCGQPAFSFYGFRRKDYAALALVSSVLPAAVESIAIVFIVSMPWGKMVTGAALMIIIIALAPFAFFFINYLSMAMRARITLTHHETFPARSTPALAMHLRLSAWPCQSRTVTCLVWTASLLLAILTLIFGEPGIFAYCIMCISQPKLAQKLTGSSWQAHNRRAYALYSISKRSLLRAEYRSLFLLLLPYALCTIAGALALTIAGTLSFYSCAALLLIFLYLMFNSLVLIFAIHTVAARKTASLNDAEATLIFLFNLIPAFMILVCILLILLPYKRTERKAQTYA